MENNKPFYKKWWFYLILLVLIGNIARLGKDFNKKNYDPVKLPTETTKIELNIETMKEIEIPSFEETDENETIKE